MVRDESFFNHDIIISESTIHFFPVGQLVVWSKEKQCRLFNVTTNVADL